MPKNSGAQANFPTLNDLPTTGNYEGRIAWSAGKPHYHDGTTWNEFGGSSSGYNIGEIGSVMLWTGKQDPSSEYALMDGQTLSKTSFPDGYTFAQGEVAAGNTDWSVTSSTFTVPNYQDRFIYNTGSKARTAKGGTETVTLTALQSGVNSNGTTGNDTPDHAHNTSIFQIWVPGNAGGGTMYVDSNSGGSTRQTSGATARHHHLLTGRNADQAHNNMPPYVVLAMFVKVAGVSASADVITGPTGPTGAVTTTPIAWTDLTLASGFTAYGAGFNTPSYYKGSDGRIHLRGRVKTAGVYTGSTMATLPAGYRPVADESFVVGQSVTSGYGRVDVNDIGTIVQQTTTATNGWVSLDGVSFAQASGPLAVAAGPQGAQGLPGANGAAGAPGGASGFHDEQLSDSSYIDTTGAGQYLVMASVTFTSFSSYDTAALVQVASGGGTLLYETYNVSNLSQTNSATLTLPVIVATLAAIDYLELYVTSSSATVSEVRLTAIAFNDMA